MIKHTPGPWHSRGTLGLRNAEHLKGHCVVEVASNGLRLAILNGWRTEQQAANARMMAAAPELLDALDRLLMSADVRDAADAGALKQARAAIANATGVGK